MKNNHREIEQKHLLFEMLSKSIGALLVLLFGTAQLSHCQPVFAQTTPARTFYVSSKALNNGDGSSWEKPWNELDKIDWSVVNPGDRIELDGGITYVPYRTTLTVKKSGSATASSYTPITIAISSAAGHNGQVDIQGGTTRKVGIDIGDNSCIKIDGRGIGGSNRNRIRVYGFTDCGINVGPKSVYVTLNNLDVSYNFRYDTKLGTGVKWQGRMGGANNCKIHDNPTNVNLVPSGTQNPNITLYQCWIYTMDSSLKKSSGVVFNGIYGYTYSSAINTCIIGPGLVDGINVTGVQPVYSTQMTIYNCLFLNAVNNNINIGPGNKLSLPVRLCTSFMTPLNAEGQAHAFIKVAESQSPASLQYGIVYGGAIVVPSTYVLNKSAEPFKTAQWLTSGNTLALGNLIVDPKFNTNLADMRNNVSPTIVANKDYSLSSSSTVVSKGCNIKSTMELMNRF